MTHYSAILRRWRAGYRLHAIAKELKCSPAHVLTALAKGGVTRLQIEARSTAKLRTQFHSPIERKSYGNQNEKETSSASRI
jgi:hypothetical protein